MSLELDFINAIEGKQPRQKFKIILNSFHNFSIDCKFWSNLWRYLVEVDQNTKWNKLGLHWQKNLFCGNFVSSKSTITAPAVAPHTKSTAVTAIGYYLNTKLPKTDEFLNSFLSVLYCSKNIVKITYNVT